MILRSIILTTGIVFLLGIKSGGEATRNFGVSLRGVRNCAVRVNSCGQYCAQHPRTHVLFQLNPANGDMTCVLVNDTTQQDAQASDRSSQKASFFTSCCKQEKEEKVTVEPVSTSSERLTNGKDDSESKLVRLTTATLTCCIIILLLCVCYGVFSCRKTFLFWRKKAFSPEPVIKDGSLPTSSTPHVVTQQASGFEPAHPFSPAMTTLTTPNNAAGPIQPPRDRSTTENDGYDRVTFMRRQVSSADDDATAPNELALRPNEHADEMYAMAEQYAAGASTSTALELKSRNVNSDYIWMPLPKSKRTNTHSTPLARYDVLNHGGGGEDARDPTEVYNVLDRQKASVGTNSLLINQVIANKTQLHGDEATSSAVTDQHDMISSM